ncbi:MAG: sodium/solute symporter [Kiritimatiellae bacterium]|nr:sodium/solute symporter [Kiritimatiellia bacterium]
MQQTGFGLENTIILIGYLLVMVLIGLFFSRKQKSTEDFFLAGRRMPWLPVAMSMYASLTSAVTYMGLPGLAYRSNITLIVVAVVSPLLAPILIFLFYPVYRRHQVTTSYEYIGIRFGLAARRVASGLFLLGRLGWLGTVVYAPALALSVVSGMPMAWAILIIGLVATLYTVLGGLSAVLWTDVAQFVILVGGAIWVAVTLCGEVPDGLSGILHTAREQDHLQLDWKISLFRMSAVVVAVSFFFQMMQDYGTDQVTVQRLLAVRTYKGMAKAVVFNAVTDSVLISILLFIGLGIFAFYTQFPGLQPSEAAGDRIFPYFIMHQLPNGISGLLISAVFAAAMSSLDSGLNSLATVIVHDFCRPFRRVPRSEQHDLRLARGLTLALGVTATGIAFFVSGMAGIVEAFATFMSLFSAPVLALFLLGMLTWRGRFSAWCAGVAVSVPATWILQRYTEVNWVYYFPFSFLVCFSIAWLASCFLRIEPERE